MVVELENVVVRFGDIQAVAGASLQADESEVYGLLGPNGAGKTTSLRVLTTLLQTSSAAAR
jgi:ABC-type multidrug transport system ATPase subunit